MPNYLIDYLHLSPQQMGFVMSAIGFGGFFGEFLVAGASDILGRKITGILSFARRSDSARRVYQDGRKSVLLICTPFCDHILLLRTAGSF